MNGLETLRKRYDRQVPIRTTMDSDVTRKQGVPDRTIVDHVRHHVDRYAGNGGLPAVYAARDANKIEFWKCHENNT